MLSRYSHRLQQVPATVLTIQTPCDTYSHCLSVLECSCCLFRYLALQSWCLCLSNERNNGYRLLAISPSTTGLLARRELPIPQ